LVNVDPGSPHSFENQDLDEFESEELEFDENISYNKFNNGGMENRGISRMTESGKQQIQSSLGTARSVCSVALGVGEMDSLFDPLEEKKITTERPFLILDVRDSSEYKSNHLIYSENFQLTRLNRAFDYETKPMLMLKNKPGTIIVLYDEDESLASKCATTLTQRGYDNVFMLSGGIKVAKSKYPEHLIQNDNINTSKLSETDLLALEQMLEENIKIGESRTSRLTSRCGRSNSVVSRTSSSRQWCNDELPARTSTAMGKKLF